MKCSVIISTYNSIEWLKKTIWGFSIQSNKDFEIVIADDGSDSKTAEAVNKLIAETGLIIKHVWQEDDGFQKTKILNQAILASSTDYLVFTDGDCIPRADFIDIHLSKRKIGHFLSGGYFKLPKLTSDTITKEDIVSQICFSTYWLYEQGLQKTYKTLKLSASELQARFLNFITPTNASWNGHNASGWKSDILAVNGFDERMQYGGEDRELGERLVNYGIKPIQIRYSAVCIHLDHKRGYVSETAIEKNKAIRNKTKQNRLVWTDFGIIKNSTEKNNY